MKRIKRLFFNISVLQLVCFLALSSELIAQDGSSEKQWSFLVEPYIMLPSIAGNTGIGESLLLPVDADPGDIFKVLSFAAMLNLEAQTDKWAITSDFIYMNLNDDVTPGVVINEATVGLKQVVYDFAGLYRIASFLEVGAGGRINYVQTSLEGWANAIPVGLEPISGRQHKSWFDPIIITRLTSDINDKWLFSFRGDIGGFGVGSDLTWMLQGYAGYQFTKVFQVSAGYRFLSIDYLDGGDRKDFVFDLNEYGPMLKFGFNF